MGNLRQNTIDEEYWNYIKELENEFIPKDKRISIKLSSVIFYKDISIFLFKWIDDYFILSKLMYLTLKMEEIHPFLS
jgi:hypothetical protein